MDITSKIYLENGVFVCLSLKDDKLDYELEYNEEKYDGEPYNKFNVYKKINDGTKIYKNVYYENVRHNSIEKNKPLKEGYYLFVFNKTKIFIELNNNKISYELENNGIEKSEFDLS
jgi:hypothetical protein